MLKPRVPGYHGNQIKRRISSESRNLNYSDSFIEGKMKIPFTVQRAQHSKDRKKKKRRKRYSFFFLTTRFKAMPLKFKHCLMTTGALTLSKHAQRNDVTTVCLKLQINLLPWKGQESVRLQNPQPNPAHVWWNPQTAFMGLDATVSGVVNDFMCRTRMRFKKHTSSVEPDRAYISERGLCCLFRLFCTETYLWSAEYQFLISHAWSLKWG